VFIRYSPLQSGDVTKLSESNPQRSPVRQ